MKPIISIIIPTHNRFSYLREALRSIYRQSFTDWEIIIVDDCSEPPLTYKDIEGFESKVKIERHNNNLGGPAAKNTGARIANGKYIAFLDDDDLYAPDYLLSAINTLDSCSHIKVIFMGVKWFKGNLKWEEYNQNDTLTKIIADAADVEIVKSCHQFNKNLLFISLLNGVPMAFQRPVTSKEHFIEVGFYNESCLLWDCEWALRASLKDNCGLLNQGLYLQRADNQGYFSQPNKRIEQSISVIEIIKSFVSQDLKPDLMKSIKYALIKALKDLCWEYSNQHKYVLALKTVLESFRYQFSLIQIKLFIGVIYKAIKNN